MPRQTAPIGSGSIHVSLLAIPEAVVSTLSGIFDVMNAFKIMPGLGGVREPPFRVEIAGRRPGSLELASHVPVTVQKGIKAIEATDIVIVPSREESFSMVTAEAMLNGIPVVASNLEPLRDLLDGTSSPAGLLFPIGDEAAAARAIAILAEDAELRARLGAEGKRRASAFRVEEVAARFLRSYGVADERSVGGEGLPSSPSAPREPSN